MIIDHKQKLLVTAIGILFIASLVFVVQLARTNERSTLEVNIAELAASSTANTADNNERDLATSQNGKYSAYSKDQENLEYDPVDPINFNELWLKDNDTNKEYVLVKSGKIKALNIKNVNESNFPFDEIRNLYVKDFSSDGNTIYFFSRAWTTSLAIFSVNIKTNEIRFITDSNYLEVIKSGQYKDMLITNHHRYYEDKEGSYDYYYITDHMTGKDIKTLGEEKIIVH